MFLYWKGRRRKIKYCKRCKKAFDIAINYDECPRCRKVGRGKRRGGRKWIK